MSTYIKSLLAVSIAALIPLFMSCSKSKASLQGEKTLLEISQVDQVEWRK